MKCPSCGARYDSGIYYCEPCQRALGAVDEAGGRPTPSGDLVRVFHTTDVTEVPIVRSLLEAEGIPCLVRGEQALLMNRFVQALGWGKSESTVEVLVPAERATEAGELLGLAGTGVDGHGDDLPPGSRLGGD